MTRKQVDGKEGGGNQAKGFIEWSVKAVWSKTP